MMPSEKSSDEILLITPEEAGLRLDKILANRFASIQSRTYFQRLIEEERVLVNGEPVKKRIQPKEGDEVEIEFILTPELQLTPEAIPLKIIYEDEHLLAIDKPAGMVVHPAVGNWSGTFVNALLYHCQMEAPLGDVRPGIVHRLDKDTTGLLLAAKHPLAQQKLIALFASRRIEKTYWAICAGHPPTGVIDAPIGRSPVNRKLMAVLENGGRRAVSRIRPLKFKDPLSLVEVLLETGRTHQIRVHLKHRNAPVLGDSIYGSEKMNKRFQAGRQMLHAKRLRFEHPMTGEALDLEAPVPEDMQDILREYLS